MLDEILKRCNEADIFAAIEFLNQQGETLTILDTYNDLLLHFYNEAKNVPVMVIAACAGIQYGLLRAAVDLAQAAEIKGRVKSIAYNLAANTWPGWDDPGITISPAEMVIGMQAARANLRLALELERGDLPMSRAYWLLGAQLIAAQQFDSAKNAFIDAARFAAAAGEEAESLLAKGFGALVDMLQGGDETALQTIKTELIKLQDGSFFAGQIETARRVFSA
jgi:hypothetical protein